MNRAPKKRMRKAVPPTAAPVMTAVRLEPEKLSLLSAVLREVIIATGAVVGVPSISVTKAENMVVKLAPGVELATSVRTGLNVVDEVEGGADEDVDRGADDDDWESEEVEDMTSDDDDVLELLLEVVVEDEDASGEVEIGVGVGELDGVRVDLAWLVLEDESVVDELELAVFVLINVEGAGDCRGWSRRGMVHS